MCSSNKKYGAIAIFDMNNIKGFTRFKMKSNNKIFIEYEIYGLKDGKHGFHIHQYGDLSDGCNSACSHFNPDNTDHGGPYSKIRHAGDLGNITAINNIAKGTITVEGLSTDHTSKRSIIGRSIIIHEDPDDLGRGGNIESKKTGNAGARLCCAVIGIYSL